MHKPVTTNIQFPINYKFNKAQYIAWVIDLQVKFLDLYRCSYQELPPR